MIKLEQSNLEFCSWSEGDRFMVVVNQWFKTRDEAEKFASKLNNMGEK